MIRHVVSLRLGAENAAIRDDHSARLAAALRALPAQIPEVLRYEVGQNSLGEGKNWDLVIIGDYADADALETYKAHPAHRQVVAYIDEVAAERVTVDFLV